MPIQIIITGNDAQEAMSHMASFIGMRGLSDQYNLDQRQVDKTVSEQQALGAVTTEAVKPKPVGRPKKEAKPEPQKEEPAEQAAADDADEAQQAEVEKQAQPGATADDVRAAMNEYVKKFGLDNCTTDVAWIFNKRFGGKVNKVTEIPANMLATIVGDIRDMTAKNPFEREAAN
jgi:outer membrane biosynthesis protein TonB